MNDPNPYENVFNLIECIELYCKIHGLSVRGFGHWGEVYMALYMYLKYIKS